jgi:hypothetical protein
MHTSILDKQPAESTDRSVPRGFVELTIDGLARHLRTPRHAVEHLLARAFLSARAAAWVATREQAALRLVGFGPDECTCEPVTIDADRLRGQWELLCAEPAAYLFAARASDPPAKEGRAILRPADRPGPALELRFGDCVVQRDPVGPFLGWARVSFADERYDAIDPGTP